MWLYRTNWPINLGIIGMCVIEFGRLIRRILFSFLCFKRGAVATFATEGQYHRYFSPQRAYIWLFEATGFSAAFPGIKPHLLTLATNFQMPFYRDILLALGVCSVSKQSCSNILKSGPGSAITIVVGGAAESLSAHPGTADLTLRRRSGLDSLEALFQLNYWILLQTD